MSGPSFARRVLLHPRVEPAVATALRARLVADPLRFALNERAWRGRVVAHRLRGTRLRVVLEHGSPDVDAFDELFHRQIYAPPPEVDAVLAALGRPLEILDIGANIGLFGVWALARWPDAVIDAFEPDPRNAAHHARAIERNGGRASWRLHRAAAAASDGTMRFAAGNYATSARAEPGTAGAIEVPARDVLGLMGSADLIKLDAEGGEWELLQDPRFAATSARAIAIEYHPERCPSPDSRGAAADLLGRAGFTVRDAPTAAPPGHGSLWAWRSPPGRST